MFDQTLLSVLFCSLCESVERIASLLETPAGGFSLCPPLVRGGVRKERGMERATETEKANKRESSFSHQKWEHWSELLSCTANQKVNERLGGLYCSRESRKEKAEGIATLWMSRLTSVEGEQACPFVCSKRESCCSFVCMLFSSFHCPCVRL